MYSCVITGSIGCGKSSASLILRSALGNSAHYFSADNAARTALEVPLVIEALVDFFGTGCLESIDQHHKINNQWLRETVFHNAIARNELEKIVHPIVFDALAKHRDEARNIGCEFFLAEVPLYYEIGQTVEADLIIVVAASRTVQKKRLMERRGLNEELIENILRSQWSIEDKVEKAEVVIWNDGEIAAFETQVLTLARQLRLA